MRARSSLLITLAVVSCATAGCGLRREPASSASGFPITTRDAAGKAVRVLRLPARIVSLDAAATRTLEQLGAKVFPATTVSGIPALRPDFVVAPLDADTAALANGAPGVPVFLYGGANLGQAGAVIARLGLAAGRGAAAVALAESVDDQVAAALRGAAQGSARTVFISRAGLRADGPETAVGRLVARAGGRNIVTETRFDLTFTTIARADPEVWFVEPGAGTTLAALKRNTLMRAVRAVRQNRVLGIRLSDFEPSPSLAATVTSLVSTVRTPP